MPKPNAHSNASNATLPAAMQRRSAHDIRMQDNAAHDGDNANACNAMGSLKMACPPLASPVGGSTST
eukprot:8854472-Pyramimonas_sp.AAC.2